jgi:hypothetical protein
MVTRVPSIKVHAHYVVPSLDPFELLLLFSRCLFCYGLRLHEFLGSLSRSYARRPVRNHEMRRFLHDSLHVEIGRALHC